MAGMKKLGLLSVCLFLMYAGSGLSFPFMAVYLTGRRGVPPGTTGLILSLFVLASALGSAAGGWAADRWGRKATMVGSLASRTVFSAALVPAVAGGGLGMLIAVHFAYSLLGHAFEPATRSWVADQFPPRERFRAYSLLRLAPNLGWAVGPAVGSIVPFESYPLLFAGTAGINAVCSVLVGVFIPETRPGPSASTGPVPPSALLPPSDRPTPAIEGPLPRGPILGLHDPRFLAYCGWVVLLSLVMAQFIVGLSIHATRFAGLTPGEVGFLFTLNGALVVALQVWASNLLVSWKLTKSLAVGSLLYAAGFAWVGFSKGLGSLAAAVAVVTLGEIVVSPAMLSLAANLAPPAERGRYMGLHGLASHLGMALGPAAGGWGIEVLGRRGPPLPWLAVAACGVGAAWGFRRLAGQVRPQEDSPHEGPPR